MGARRGEVQQAAAGGPSRAELCNAAGRAARVTGGVKLGFDRPPRPYGMELLQCSTAPRG